MITPGREPDHVSPEAFVGYALRRQGLSAEAATVGRAVVFDWTRGEVEAAEPATPGWYNLRSAGGVSILRAGVGAPAAVIQAEEMAVLGMRYLVGIGYCGSLQPDLPVSALVIAGACVREEGTSYHYLAAHEAVGPSPRVVEALRAAGAADARVGRHWSTDAIYRETRDKVRAYAAEGVLAVDMEAAALYAVARYRGFQAALLLVVSDELWQEPWRPGFAETGAASRRALAIAWEAAARLAAGG